MTNTAKLEAAIKASGYRKAFLAEQLGMSRRNLALCINNRAEFRASHIQTLCELLRLDKAQKESIFFDLDVV